MKPPAKARPQHQHRSRAGQPRRQLGTSRRATFNRVERNDPHRIRVFTGEKLAQIGLFGPRIHTRRSYPNPLGEGKSSPNAATARIEGSEILDVASSLRTVFRTSKTSSAPLRDE